ncbi:hypothetical protein QYB59_001541 [Clostridium perfringens]|nr:hypothetical protein [Clostridium perfringens]
MNKNKNKKKINYLILSMGLGLIWGIIYKQLTTGLSVSFLIGLALNIRINKSFY